MTTDNSAVIARLQSERDALAESLRACSKALREEVESRRGSELDRRVDRDLAEVDDADDILASLDSEPAVPDVLTRYKPAQKVIEYLKESIYDATHCEDADMDDEFAAAAEATINLINNPKPPASRWIPCREQFPTSYDEDENGQIWRARWSWAIYCWEIELVENPGPHENTPIYPLKPILDRDDLWKPTGLRRPEPPQGGRE